MGALTEVSGLRTSARGERYRRLALSAVSVGATLAAWQVVTGTGLVSPILLSSPSQVVRAGVELIRSGELGRHLAASLNELVVGFLLACAVGVPLAVVTGRYRRAGWVARPFAGAFYATPVIVFAPLIVALLGIGFWDKVCLVFLDGALQVFITVNAGVRALDREWLRLARGFGASEPTILRTIVVPGAVPYIVTGMRLAAGRGLVTVVVAELLASSAGLGYMIAFYGQNFRTPNVFVGLAVVATLGIIIDDAFRRLQHRVHRSRRTA